MEIKLQSSSSTLFPALDAEVTKTLFSGEAMKYTSEMANGDPWPRITIVTPSFKQAKYLEKTAISILSQGYPNLEYIIMDGGSTDGTLEIIKKYSAQLTCWESKPDKGQYDAVQKGFDISHGEIMAYLNSDDLYFPWTLNVVSDIFAKFPQVDWLTTSMVSMTSHDNRLIFGGQIYNRSRRWFFSTRGKSFKTRGFIPQESTFWRRPL
jgi:glycosyltransferase involved in cell wall biosynthesis